MAGSAGVRDVIPDLDLHEQDFTYCAGKVDRPWAQFAGRWQAMKPYLAASLKARGTERPLRIVDVGSCNGYFSLQAANQHSIADVVGIEGSVGVGNGTVGAAGSVRQILETPAVQSHLRHITKFDLPNSFLAPEVWDYSRIKKLGSAGKPICDVMFLLSVVHHIDGVSHEQYLQAGVSHVQGSLDLLANLLLLAPCHFVELPNPPWIEQLYAVYKTPRAILDAAAKASGRKWKFTGPIYSSEWFGQRDLWLLEEDLSGGSAPMPEVDVQDCPFPVLFRGDEPDLEGLLSPRGPHQEQLGGSQGLFDDSALLPAGGRGLAAGDGGGLAAMQRQGLGLGGLSAFDRTNLAYGELSIDPGLLTLSEDRTRAEPRIGAALSAAPVDLLLAHLALRDAISEASYLLQTYAASAPAFDDVAQKPVEVRQSEFGVASLHA
eukprot:TRINITY_DN122376_c0_g1_i1.p1 TRINITY_DN122376_c0_g1~~TRINITY_DN122376_c0_g1_i1.p1  ORF type:complete len:456 (-),score=90.58 TRINITY_DN122376_c0_g1_i1:53-1351(-)